MYMEKTSLIMIVNDLPSRRDALSLAHEQLKTDSDSWNKCVIVLCLGTGMFKRAKIQMGWNNNLVAWASADVRKVLLQQPHARHPSPILEGLLSRCRLARGAFASCCRSFVFVSLAW